VTTRIKRRRRWRWLLSGLCMSFGLLVLGGCEAAQEQAENDALRWASFISTASAASMSRAGRVTLAVHFDATEIDRGNAARVRDVIQGIGIEHDEVCTQPWCE